FFSFAAQGNIAGRVRSLSRDTTTFPCTKPSRSPPARFGQLRAMPERCRTLPCRPGDEAGRNHPSLIRSYDAHSIRPDQENAMSAQVTLADLSHAVSLRHSPISFRRLCWNVRLLRI